MFFSALGHQKYGVIIAKSVTKLTRHLPDITVFTVINIIRIQ